MECENGICKLPTAKSTARVTTPTTTSDSVVDLTTPAIPDQLKALPWSHFVDGEGKHVSPSALQRPLTVYIFSAAWCGPCGALAPTIEALHKAHRDTDLDVVYIGFDRTLDEHVAKSKLPYFKFTWFQDEQQNKPIPVEHYADQPDNVNPFRMVFRDVHESLGKKGIPAIIVVDSATGKIVDDLANLSLFNVTGSKTLEADLARIVSLWRAGQPASTSWMRTRSAIIRNLQMLFFFGLVFPIVYPIDWIVSKFSQSPKTPVKSESDDKAKDQTEASEMEPTANKNGPTKAA